VRNLYSLNIFPCYCMVPLPVIDARRQIFIAVRASLVTVTTGSLRKIALMPACVSSARLLSLYEREVCFERSWILLLDG
jgi:hypothetical protein